MQRAALYARVSTDAQKQEGTIESQIAELRRQIAAAGHVLVKEYIDDGYTGSRMDRPALQELRRDLRADVFDVIYFLAADRIARAVIYQTIIIGEMLLYKKEIVINGQQYIDKSENKFTMTVLGAVAELERAKITERMTRGKLHRLRQGVMASGGVAPFGYRYTQPSPNAPRALVPKEPEAEVVRWMFETYAAGATLRSLAKSLEQRGVRTRFGKELWAYAQIRDMMNNPTYAGMRYFNRRTEVKDDPQRKRGRTILRDRSEWIGIAVPPLVSTALFDRVQERLAENLQRYLQPAAHYALSGLVECGECGSAFCSYRRYVTKELVAGVKRVSHKAAYKCNWRVRQLEHDAKLVERCRNPEVATHLLEGKVFEMIRETMFDPSKLRACVQAPVKRDGERGIARRLGRIARHIVAIEEDRKRLIELYACERLGSRAYIEANRELDAKLARLKREKREIAAGVLPLDAETVLDASIRAFCEEVKAQFNASADPDARRAFLAGRIERIIYRKHQVTIVGAVPLPSIDGDEVRKAAFRIGGEIDIEALKSRPRPAKPGDGRFRTWNPKHASAAPAVSPALRPALVIGAESATL